MLQVFVYGDSLKAQLVAVVVPDPEVLLPWARERNLPQVTVVPQQGQACGSFY